MPELPEVETIANGLNKRVAGDRIETVWIGSKPEPLKTPAAVMARALEGARVDRVHRVGKHIVFDLSSGNSAPAQWIVHLGMTGRMLVAAPESELPRHTHLVAKMASGRELRFVDPRRFGRLEVRKSAFSGPGAEPLNITAAGFAALFHKSRSLIKAALLNQRFLHGVGNIYADESLFRAGIRPRRRANTLTRAELDKLHAAVQEVLKEAIAAGGSSISDYVDAEGEAGFFQFQHRAYGREDEPCPVCRTPIKKIVVAGRGTHYCPKCQK
ncbi:MAG TPA: bifunctional DNA-formamidopyrimidine glycosylase/DNA-(apurinic or apyrimidinic site) lyase [Candidatus Limnocylindrales bacterium]|nr:bifunctional DNA-formamidopyrimidine glycosylase/DNA-(apurinic or apyrimidinic site) lyase [Candidatus Limnocylindrales bacterium]